MLETIFKFARENSESDDIHGFPHIERVYSLCLKIGKKLDADIKILKIAALLHDIGRNKEGLNSFKRNHAEISAELAINFLTNMDIGLPKEDIENIIHCIRSHSFSNEIKPKTLEAKILSDADKLDALGAIGLYRTIGFTVKSRGGIDQVIEHLENKIMKLRNQMYLDVSKKIANDRERIILDFYNSIIREK
ncbi:MAG: HD domain-containing protein [Candidatus Hermodarchaeota archaeon]